MGKGKFFAVLILAAIALLSGCLSDMIESSTAQYLSDSHTAVSAKMNATNLTEYANAGNCSIMLCQNASRKSFVNWAQFMYYSVRYWKWMDASLIGGNCWLQNVTFENKAEIAKNLNDSTYYIREFGIGQGMTFADFNNANTYCNNSLRYAVKLVRSLDAEKYTFSSKSYTGAACFLDKSVIPLYILYNNGTVPGKDNAGGFARQMSGLGPVMIATEMNPESSDTNIENIASQIRGISAACSNCKVGLSIRNGPNGTRILDALSASHALDKVDFVGFGIDSDYLIDSNEDSKCGSGSYLVSQAQLATNAIRAKYGKPTFWYYVNLNRSACRWSDLEERKLLWLMFNDIPEMSKNGLMGMSSEPFYSEAFFYPAENNSFVDSSTSLRQSAASAWFSLCQNYYGGRNFQVFAMDTSSIGKCGVLDFIPENTMSYAGTQSTGDYVPLAEINFGDSEKQTYECRACFMIYDSKNISAFLKNIKGVFRASNCEKPEDAANRINFYGDLYDIDTNLLKAIAQKESDFNPCTISYLPELSAGLCTGKIIKKSDISTAATAAGCSVSSMADPPSDNQKYTVCASGMMQTTDLPGSMYASLGLAMPAEVKACGGEKFNPFVAADSICAASYKIAWNFLPAAYSAVTANSETLKVASFSDENNQNLLDALTVAFTAELYYGYSLDDGGTSSDTYLELWRDFRPNVDKGGDCKKMNNMGRVLCCNSDGDYKNQYGVCGQPNMDPVTFYSKVKGSYGKIQYGMDTLSIYIDAIDECGGCASSSYYNAMDAKIKIYAPGAQLN
jgi:hypothetical protein